MLLFQPEHVRPILERRKTQTRRIWKRWRVAVGSTHPCYTRPPWIKKDPGTPFCDVLILERKVEKLVEISEFDARAEGYRTASLYLEAFARIYRMNDAEIRELEIKAVWFSLLKVRA